MYAQFKSSGFKFGIGWHNFESFMWLKRDGNVGKTEVFDEVNNQAKTLPSERGRRISQVKSTEASGSSQLKSAREMKQRVWWLIPCLAEGGIISKWGFVSLHPWFSDPFPSSSQLLMSRQPTSGKNQRAPWPPRILPECRAHIEMFPHQPGCCVTGKRRKCQHFYVFKCYSLLCSCTALNWHFFLWTYCF